MGRKRDLKEVDAVADAFDMDDDERFAFGDFLEDCKAQGGPGDEERTRGLHAFRVGRQGEGIPRPSRRGVRIGAPDPRGEGHMIELIDLRAIRRECSDLSELNALLQQVVGQPFLFFRVSYGDELRLHLGDVKCYSSPKMQGRTRGSYIIGARASSWIVVSAPRHLLATSGDGGSGRPETPATARAVDLKTIETGGFITPGSIVTSAGADRSAPGLSFQLRCSDGSTAHI